MNVKKYLVTAATAGGLVICTAWMTGCGAGAATANIEAGMAAVTELDYEAALLSFGAAEAAGENPRLLHRGRGLALMGQSDYEKAAESFIRALSYSGGILDNLDYDINYYLAASYYKMARPDEAVAIYDAILALREKETEAYFLRGAIKTTQGKLDEARADFDQALLLDKQNNERLIDIYCVLAESKYPEVGREYLEAALADEGKNLSDFEKGRISYYLGDYEKARNWLQSAKDSSFEAVLFLGKTHEILGDYNYAVSVYNAFLADDNESPQIYNQLGICKLEMGEYAEALTAFQSGMQIEHNEVLQTLRFNEIITYEYLGEYTTAAVLMSEYVKAYPEDETARREYLFLQTR